jgi:hypothetical protein
MGNMVAYSHSLCVDTVEGREVKGSVGEDSTNARNSTRRGPNIGIDGVGAY